MRYFDAGVLDKVGKIKCKKEGKMKCREVLVLIFLAFSLVLADYDADLYFPLAVGNVWFYKDSSFVFGAEVDTVHMEVVGTAIMEGYLTYISIETNLSSTSVDTTFFQSRGDGIYMYSPDEGRSLLMLPDPFDVGDEWTLSVDTSWMSAETTVYTRERYTGRVVSFEDVSIGIGSFNNCAKVVVSFFARETKVVGGITVSDDSTMGSLTSWYAENIGVVKEHTQLSIWFFVLDMFRELLSWSSGVDEVEIKRQEFRVSVSPNPFNSSCRVVAPVGSNVEICDISGRVVYAYQADRKEFIWEPDGTIGSGVYFVKVRKGNNVATQRVVLLK